MSVSELGSLDRVDIRAVWPDEARDFTPWLAQEQNIELLGNAIGLDLRVTGTERAVGPFSADILCQDLASDDPVVIENQFGKTNHDHLGKLLTYGAGLEALTAIWVSERITAEHRAALDWLNKISGDTVAFFALEIEVWKIGDSLPAPKFNVVCQPNDWGKTVAAQSRGELTENRQLQLEFWTEFAEFIRDRQALLRPRKPSPRGYMRFAIGRKGVSLAAVASLYDSEQGNFGSHELRAELVLRGENAKVFYEQLHEDRSAIQSELGEPLTWSEGAGQQSRIYLRTPTDLTDRESWSDSFTWLLAKLEQLHKVFAARVGNLAGVGPQAA